MAAVEVEVFETGIDQLAVSATFVVMLRCLALWLINQLVMVAAVGVEVPGTWVN